jgi:hypothetical protein
MHVQESYSSGAKPYGFSYKSEIFSQVSSTPMVFKGTSRYFILKSNTHENLQMSLKEEVWATTLKPTRKLQTHFQKVDNIILIFSVNESSCFQGIARMESRPDPNYKPDL